MTGDTIVAVARHLLFVREQAPNDGLWVGFIQRFTGNRPGDSWCASFVCLVLAIAYRGLSPLKITASCQLMLNDARTKGYIVPSREPQVGDLFFYLNPVGVAHHVGFVTAVKPLSGIAGNTSDDGKSVNGTGVYEHAIDAHVFVRLPER